MDFGNIRSLLQQTPTTHNFIRLCKMLTPWRPEHYVAELEPYLIAHLESWPDEVRLLPPQWMNQWSVWGHDPRVAICRAARCDMLSAFDAFLYDTPDWLTHLTLFRVDIQRGETFSVFANLRHLEMRRVNWRSTFDLAQWRAIEHLSVQQCEFAHMPQLECKTLKRLVCLNQHPPLHQWSLPETLIHITLDDAEFVDNKPFYAQFVQRGVHFRRQ